MSFNIRYANRNDGDNWWGHRKEAVLHLIQYYQPDVLGLQEALPHQYDFLVDQMKGYESVGHGRDGAGSDSEAVPILYKKKRYDLLKGEVLWLSETPKKVSKGWDAALNRITTYAMFYDKERNDTLHVFNAHFDHLGQTAREKSAQVMLSFLKDKALLSKRVLVMGDFNALPEEKPIKTLTAQLQDAYKASKQPAYGPVGTFTGFDTEMIAQKRIDYVFSQNLKVVRYRVIDDRRKDNLYPSDHFPVWVEFR